MTYTNPQAMTWDRRSEYKRRPPHFAPLCWHYCTWAWDGSTHAMGDEMQCRRWECRCPCHQPPDAQQKQRAAIAATAEFGATYAVVIEAGVLRHCREKGGYYLWVTDYVRDQQGDPERPIYWYWARESQFPHSFSVCTIADVWEALIARDGVAAYMIDQWPGDRELTIRLRYDRAPLPTRAFMRWP